MEDYPKGGAEPSGDLTAMGCPIVWLRAYAKVRPGGADTPMVQRCMVPDCDANGEFVVTNSKGESEGGIASPSVKTCAVEGTLLDIYRR